jgi:predicted PolB exonuclease-like 3'-5' exonuclease
MNLVIDLETVPSQLQWVREDIASTIKPPGTLKKAESIAAWERDEKPAAIEEAYAKTSFDGGLGQIVVIGWAFDEGDTHALQVVDLTAKSEAAMLEVFFSDMSKIYKGTSGTRPCVVGFNHVGFDLPFMAKRCIVHGIKPPFWWPRDPKPWSDAVYDCMVQWSGVKDRISMDKLCRILGIPGKGDGPTGADVWPMVQAGKLDEVATYCRADVERTRAMHKRMTFAETT